MNEYASIVIGSDHSNLLSVIRGLGRVGKKFFAIIVCEDKPNVCVRSKYLKDFIVCTETEILKNLCQMGEKLSYKIPVICCDDPSAYIVDRNLDKLSKFFYCPSINGAEGKICQMMDKQEQYLLAQKYHIDMADTYVISFDDGINEAYKYPLILKPRFSAFGCKSDICKVENEEELYQAIKMFRQKGYKDILVQHYLETDYECTFFGVILGENGSTCNGIRKILRWPRVGGSAVFGVTIKPFHLIEKILHILGEMGYVGMYDIELYVKNGKYILNEINFRHTGLGYVELANGTNSSCYIIDYFNGHELSKNKAFKRVYCVNSIALASMLRAKEISILDFIRIELISKSHSIFALNDPMPMLNVLAVQCKRTYKKIICRISN